MTISMTVPLGLSVLALVGGLLLGGCGRDQCEEAREEVQEAGGCPGFDLTTCATIDAATDRSEPCEEAFDTYLRRCREVPDGESTCAQCTAQQMLAAAECGI